MGVLRRFAVYQTQEMVKALEDDGYAFVPDVLSPHQCASARSMVDALEPIAWDEVHSHSGHGDARFLDRYLCIFNRDPYWLQFIDRPGLIDLAEAVLGHDCHIIGMTAWRSHPGYAAEPFHVDYRPPTNDAGAADTALPPMFVVTLHMYLSHVTEEIGATRLIGGSHRARRAPVPGENQWEGRPFDTVLAREGDALVFRSDVWHAGSDNRAAHDVRYLLQVHYGRREVAQHFSPFMTWCFNPVVLASASRRQRRLLGDHDPGAYD